MDAFADLDAVEQAELVRRGEVTPTELVDAAIARIEELTPRLNAVISPTFERARRDAAALDLRGAPFRGVPFLVKDLLCQTAGDPYYQGTRFLRRARWASTADSYLGAKFR